MAQLPTTRGNQGGRLASRLENPLERLRRDFDTLFGRMWGGWLTPGEEDFGTMRLWDVDVKETDKDVIVRAELPGFEENELDVQLNQNMLTIKAEKEQKGEQQEEYRSFFRSITLPTGIDPQNVQATYRNGVLELHIPRSPEAQPRKIKVQADQPAARPALQHAGQPSTQGQPSNQPAPSSEKTKK